MLKSDYERNNLRVYFTINSQPYFWPKRMFKSTVTCYDALRFTIDLDTSFNIVDRMPILTMDCYTQFYIEYGCYCHETIFKPIEEFVFLSWSALYLILPKCSFKPTKLILNSRCLRTFWVYWTYSSGFPDKTDGPNQSYPKESGGFKTLTIF